MAPLFSKVDLNILWRDVQNEETLIYAKFGKDLFNISKVIGRKKWPSFFDSQCIYYFGDDLPSQSDDWHESTKNDAHLHDFNIQ